MQSPIQRRHKVVRELRYQLQHPRTGVIRPEPRRFNFQQLLFIGPEPVRNLGAQLGQALPNMIDQQAAQILCEVVGAHGPLQVAVFQVPFEEFRLAGLGVGNRGVLVDVRLGAVHDADVAESERDVFPAQHVDGVGALVHQIQLGDDAHGAVPLRVNSLGHLERFRRREVRIRRMHRENDRVFPLDVRQHHGANQPLDVLGLVAHGNPREAREVHQGEIHDVL
mmetsp:Transcript_11484/g.29072  ORF Transcript_11484/g.29072 Transcript_11484/m.29072 type:complete len:223 (+) Transcript_11484:843-1511(+)